MSHDDDCFEALDRVSGELRDAEGPKLDWNRVETGLFLRLDAEEAKQRGRVARTIVPSSLWRAFGFAAAAAAVMAVGAAAWHGSSDDVAMSGAPDPLAAATPAPLVAPPIAPDVLAPTNANGEHELLSLHDGDVIEASHGALRFGHAGVVSWSLEDGGRAVIRSLGTAGVGTTVALERGSIRAEVTPRAPSEGLVEAFAVEVDGTRVAVHGTAFTVTRVAHGAIVDVEHGAVAVGPVGHIGETNGRLLVGPSRALVSLDGGRTARWLAPEHAASAAATAAPSPIKIADDATATAPAANDEADDPMAPPRTADDAIASPRPTAFAPLAPPTAAPAATPAPAPERVLSQASIQADLARCFKQVYGGMPEGVSIKFSTSFKVSLNADGSVKAGHFDPVPKPEVSLCMSSALDGRFPAGTQTLTVPFSYGK